MKEIQYNLQDKDLDFVRRNCNIHIEAMNEGCVWISIRDSKSHKEVWAFTFSTPYNEKKMKHEPPLNVLEQIFTTEEEIKDEFLNTKPTNTDSSPHY